MNTLTLPEPIAAYFAAEHNPEALAHCFTSQAVMKDDGHTYTGINAIKAFMGEDYSVSHVPAEARAVLNSFDDRAAHFEIIDRRDQ